MTSVRVELPCFCWSLHSAGGSAPREGLCPHSYPLGRAQHTATMPCSSASILGQCSLCDSVTGLPGMVRLCSLPCTNAGQHVRNSDMERPGEASGLYEFAIEHCQSMDTKRKQPSLHWTVKTSVIFTFTALLGTRQQAAGSF